MSPDEPDAKHEQRSFQLTSERELSTGYRVARAAIIIYFVTFLASTVVMCSCPGFFAVMAVCAVVALACGSRVQRLLSVGLLLLAVIGFVFQYRDDQQFIERARRIKQLHEQRTQSNETGNTK